MYASGTAARIHRFGAGASFTDRTPEASWTRRSNLWGEESRSSMTRYWYALQSAGRSGSDHDCSALLSNTTRFETKPVAAHSVPRMYELTKIGDFIASGSCPSAVTNTRP